MPLARSTRMSLLPLIVIPSIINDDHKSLFTYRNLLSYSWQIVMDEHQRPNGIPVTRFTLQSIYAQSDDEKLEFDYESGNTSILVSHYMATFIYIYTSNVAFEAFFLSRLI